MQGCSNSSALAMGLLQSRTKPSIYFYSTPSNTCQHWEQRIYRNSEILVVCYGQLWFPLTKDHKCRKRFHDIFHHCAFAKSINGQASKNSAPRPPLHNTFAPYGAKRIPNYLPLIPQNIVRLKLSCKFDESECYPYRDISTTTSHGTNYVFNEHLDFSQYYPYAMPSEMILWYSYSVFKNQTETLVDVLH